MTDYAPQRALILDDLRYWAGQISEANGSNVTVASVRDRLTTFDDVADDGFPCVAIYAANSSPPPRYECHGYRAVDFDVVVAVFTRANTTAEAEEQLNLILEDLHDLINQDPTRDGWAVDTVQIAAPQDDAAVLFAKDGADERGRTATAATAYRCLYYPDDDTETPMAHGELSMTTPAATPLTPGTPVKANGTTALGLARDFDTNGVSNRLRYTGAKTRVFKVEAVLSAIGNATGVLTARIAQNGVTVAKSQQRSEVLSTNVRESTCSALLTLAQNDYVELFLDSPALTSATVQDLSLTATQVPKF